jgi:hypothetical protein
MKITLTYELPGEEEQFEAAISGLSYKQTIEELDNELRSIVKHGREGFNSEEADKIRDILYEIAGKNEVAIW